MSLELPGEFIYITQEVNCKEQSEKDDKKQVAKEALDIEELYLSRYKQLKSFVRKRVFNDQDAEDISQAAFVEAMQKRDAFRGLSRPDVWRTQIRRQTGQGNADTAGNHREPGNG